MNELIEINTDGQDLAVLFSPNGLAEILGRIEASARSIAPDPTTHKGRAEIASLAAKIARSKVVLDGTGKDFVADLKSKAKVVDIERKRMRDHLDQLKKEIRQPLTDFEAREAERQAELNRRVEALKKPHDDLPARIAELESIDTEDGTWHEFSRLAEIAIEESLAYFRAMLEEEKEKERQAIERKAKQERDRKERERLIARRAEEKTRRIAQQAAREATRRAEEKARHDAEMAEQRRNDERRREERAIREATRRAKLIEAKQRRKAEIDAERKADMNHRARVRTGIRDGLVAFGLSDNDAIRLIQAIDNGLIDHLRIDY